MRVLVTGGAGFIGSHLVDRCLSEGHSVRILDNLTPRVHPSGRPAYVPKQAEFIQGDVENRDVLSEALQGIDVIYHQAAYQDYMPDFSKFFSVNVTGTALIYELIVGKSLPVKQVILASSQAVYGEGQYSCSEHGIFVAIARSREGLSSGQWQVSCPECGRQADARRLEEELVNPFNPYAVSKFAAERAAIGLGLFYGIPTTALRYSITQGPRQSLHNQYSGIARIFGTRLLANEPLIVYEDGLQTRDFVHISDVADANLFVLGRPEAFFQSFNVGSGVSTTVLEYAEKLATKLGREPEISVSGEYRVGDNRNSVSSISKLTSLGWSPKRNLDTILGDFAKWLAVSFQGTSQLPRAHEEMASMGVVRKSSR